MLLELSQARNMLYKFIAIEGDMAINTYKGSRSASTKGVLFCLFFLQGCIAIAAHESYHIVEKFIIKKAILAYNKSQYYHLYRMKENGWQRWIHCVGQMMMVGGIMKGIGSQNNEGDITVQMRIFLVESFDFGDISFVGIIDHLVCYSFSFADLDINSSSDDDGHFERRWQKYSSPFIPEQNGRNFKFIKHKSKIEHWLESPEGFMLVGHNDGVYCVTVSQRIFDESFPVVEPASELLWGCDCGFFESSREETDVFPFFHQTPEILMIDGFNSPQFKDQTRYGEIESESAGKADQIRDRTCIDDVHQCQEAQCDDAVGVNSEHASVLFHYFFLEDHFEVLEVFHRLYELIDQIYNGLRSSDWQLQNGDGCEYPQYIQVNKYKPIQKCGNWNIECQLKYGEGSECDGFLISSKVVLLLGLTDYLHMMLTSRLVQKNIRYGQLMHDFTHRLEV